MITNGIIGSGVFALPAVIAKLLGPVSPLAFIAAALLMFAIILCFAETAGQFTETGGPYLYARESMGPLVGFEVGWITYLTRVTSVAANYAVFLEYMGYFWPEGDRGLARLFTLTALTTFQAATNILGVRQGTWLINLFTLAKLLPLGALIFVGVFHLNPAAFADATVPSYPDATRSVLLLFFAFGGFEQTTVVAGEMKNPTKDLPWALIVSLSAVTLIYVLIQIICTSTLPGLASETRPLANAGRAVFGVFGAALISGGALLSTFGHTGGSMLQSPRITYALAEGEQLPKFFAALLPRRRTPYVSILVFAAIVWALTVGGSFVQLAALSALARILTYITTALAVMAFRRTRPAEQRGFRIPAGPLLPMIAIACSVWLLSNASRKELAAGGVALAVGAALHVIARFQKKRNADLDSDLLH